MMTAMTGHLAQEVSKSYSKGESSLKNFHLLAKGSLHAIIPTGEGRLEVIDVPFGVGKRISFDGNR